MTTHSRQSFLADFLVAFAIAFGFSFFIYADHFGLRHIAALETVLALGAYYGLLSGSRRTVLLAGFFIGLLWFYWIGFSFRYYGMPWMQLPMALFFGLVYSLYFGILALSTRPYIRALLLFALTFLAPFGFNWMFG